jgi:hypothetical protein
MRLSKFAASAIIYALTENSYDNIADYIFENPTEAARVVELGKTIPLKRIAKDTLEFMENEIEHNDYIRDVSGEF